MKKSILVLCLLVAAAAGTFGWLRAHGALAVAAATATTAVSEAPVVAVIRAGRQTISRDITLTGEMVPFHEVEVMAKISGYVKQIYVDAGTRVTQGQLLAVLEVPEMNNDLQRAAASLDRNRAELGRLQDEVHRAESAYQIAHLTYSRLAGVAKTQPGLIAQQEIDDAQSRDVMAAAQVAGAHSTLAVAKEQIHVAEAELNKSRTIMEYARVVAPFSGVVTKRYADNGSMIQAGTASQTQAMPVVRLSHNDVLRLVLPVPESAAGVVKAGSQVQVRVPSLKRKLLGRVARIAEQVDVSTRTMPTEVDVPNGDQSIIPGMYAEVSLTLAARANVLAVPLSTIYEAGGSQRIRVVDTAGRIAERTVETGLQTANEIEVISGLAEGEMVVSGFHGILTQGQQVTPKLSPSPRTRGEA